MYPTVYTLSTQNKFITELVMNIPLYTRYVIYT